MFTGVVATEQQLTGTHLDTHERLGAAAVAAVKRRQRGRFGSDLGGNV